MPKSPPQKPREKSKIYEFSNGLSVLFAPLFFALAFLTGYDPKATIPFLWHSLVIFILLAFLVLASLIQRDCLKKARLTPKKLKSIDYLSYFNLICLILCALMMFLAQTD